MKTVQPLSCWRIHDAVLAWSVVLDSPWMFSMTVSVQVLAEPVDGFVEPGWLVEVASLDEVGWLVEVG